MILLLARHGNTFAPGEPVVWVGKHQDLPLVESGRTQAVRVASCLRELGLVPDEVHCGPLTRARQFAAIIGSELSLPEPALVDPRLDELDYGAWGGLTREQVEQRFGVDALRGWEQECRWAPEAGWGGSADEIERDISALVRELGTRNPGLALLVSSSGRLRFFLKLFGAETGPIRPIRTGNLAVISVPAIESLEGENLEGVEVIGWNLTPEEAFRALRSCVVS